MSGSGRLAAAPVLVAPDEFKGSFTARDVASALARGLRAGGLEADELPEKNRSLIGNRVGVLWWKAHSRRHLSSRSQQVSRASEDSSAAQIGGNKGRSARANGVLGQRAARPRRDPKGRVLAGAPRSFGDAASAGRSGGDADETHPVAGNPAVWRVRGGPGASRRRTSMRGPAPATYRSGTRDSTPSTSP